MELVGVGISCAECLVTALSGRLLQFMHVSLSSLNDRLHLMLTKNSTHQQRAIFRYVLRMLQRQSFIFVSA